MNHYSRGSSNSVFGQISGRVPDGGLRNDLPTGDDSCGTPGGVGYYREPKVLLTHGTRVEVEIDGIGVLKNRVRVTG